MARAKHSKKEIDWEKAKALFRTGSVSIKEIGRQCGCSDVAILKKAKKEGWTKDLADRVRAAVKEQLVRADAKVVRAANHAPEAQTDEEVIEAAVQGPVEVVRSHRTDLNAGQKICGILFGQLNEAATQRREIELDIAIEMDPQIATTSGAERQSLIGRKYRMLRAIELPVHAGTIRDLSNAMKNFQALERIAWNLTDKSAAEIPADEPAPNLPAGEAYQRMLKGG